MNEKSWCLFSNRMSSLRISNMNICAQLPTRVLRALRRLISKHVLLCTPKTNLENAVQGEKAIAASLALIALKITAKNPVRLYKMRESFLLLYYHQMQKRTKDSKKTA